jgi:cytidylate kinase
MSEMNIPVITIDGPSGVGKGTISRALARKLGWHYLDSGAIYRSLAAAAIKQSVALDDEWALVKLAKEMRLSFEFAGDSDEARIMLDGVDISATIGSEACGNSASKIAVLPAVRQALLEKQQDFAKAPGLVADGRDMGSVVFQKAQFKFFLTASSEERARRRYKQLKEKGIDANLEKITSELLERDLRDSKRAVAPLVAPVGATIIDSSEMSIEEVMESVINAIS